MSINWINVDVRVPDNRRDVLAWGTSTLVGSPFGGEPKFLGVTRFNPARHGGEFDVERNAHFTARRVTHWAEIEGPEA